MNGWASGGLIFLFCDPKIKHTTLLQRVVIRIKWENTKRSTNISHNYYYQYYSILLLILILLLVVVIVVVPLFFQQPIWGS